MMAHTTKAGPAEYNVADPMNGSLGVVCIVFIPVCCTAEGVDKTWGWFWQAKVTAITAEEKRRPSSQTGEISHPLGGSLAAVCLGRKFDPIALADALNRAGAAVAARVQRHVRFHAFFVRYYPETGRDRGCPLTTGISQNLPFRNR